MPQFLHIIVHAKNSVPDSHKALQPWGAGGQASGRSRDLLPLGEAKDQTPEREPASKALVADLWKPTIRLGHTNVSGIGRAVVCLGFYDTAVVATGQSVWKLWWVFLVSRDSTGGGWLLPCTKNAPKPHKVPDRTILEGSLEEVTPG